MPFPPRRWGVAALLLLLPGWSVVLAVEQTVLSVWPTPVWTVRAKLPGLQGGDADVERFAKLGEDGFRFYTEEILPRELEQGQEWREMYDGTDGSRDNLGFFRWQKKVYAQKKKLKTKELQWDGSSLPEYEGVPYKWSDLYESAEYKAFLKLLKRRCSQFLAHAPDTPEGNDKQKYRFWVWAEVYRPGDFQLPHVHTGAFVSGIYVARSNGLQELVLDDERGVHLPFGRQHRIQLTKGLLVMTPSWVRNFFTANRGNGTNVIWSFWVSDRQGLNGFDWEDDPYGELVRESNIQIELGEPGGRMSAAKHSEL